jgi:penicillin G amidase
VGRPRVNRWLAPRLAALASAVLALLVAVTAPLPPSLQASALARGPRALVVLPPGEGDTVTLSDFLANQAQGGCDGLGPHTCDQRQLYEDWGFRDGGLSSAPGKVRDAVSTEQPEDGLTIVRDSAGVPHIFATGPDHQLIEERLAFGIGYTQAEDRLFQMEILRRAGEGKLSDLLGPDYLQMDLITRRDTETARERAAAIATLTRDQRKSLQAYADGINAIIAHDQQDSSQLPAGFALVQDLPVRPWTNDDTVAVLNLEIRNVAQSAGNEAGYGALSRKLAGRYGLRPAVRILDDVQLTDDGATPLSVPRRQAARRTTDGLHYGFIRYSRRDTAARIAALDRSVGPAHQALLRGDQALGQATARLGLPVLGSNAWAIAPRRSATGHSLLWGAPQVGYYAPAVLDELEVEGGASHVRGVGVPGGGPGVVIGYTPHTAWSITTAQDDQVDTYVDRIRANPHGSGYQYLWRGAWRPVAQHTETIRVRTTSPDLPLTGQVPAPSYTDRTATFYRTFHGRGAGRIPCTVFYLDPADRRSYCRVQAYWNSELRSGLALVGANQARNLNAFQRAIRGGVAGFNFIYADDRGHIAYWHTGRIPIRAPGHDPRLPAPGGGRFDWRGFVSPSRWPSIVDPAQGFLTSWNNKPQGSWPASGDGTLWGAYQRVREPMELLARGGRFTPTRLWRVARRTGELDLRARLGFKPFLTRLRRLHLRPIERAAVAQVARWDGVAFYPGGAERGPSGTPTGRVAAPGFAIFSAWFHALEDRLGAAVFRPALGAGSVAQRVRAFTQTPQTTSPEFEFFNDYDAFLYNALTGRARGADYVGRRSALAVSRRALDRAINSLEAAQGPKPSRWRAPMPQIEFQSLDVADIPSIPWENRGTWGQAIALGAGR